VAGEFTDRFVAAMADLSVGDPFDPATEVGPLINAAAVDTVEAQVEDARAKGATILCGGARVEGPGGPDHPGCFYAPTVITDIRPGMRVATEEVFGPVALLYAVADADEALAVANDTEFGLVGYVYTGDLARGLRVSERMESGMIGLNRGLVSDPAAPFGGAKQSGIDREGGHEGLLDYTEPLYVAVNW